MGGGEGPKREGERLPGMFRADTSAYVGGDVRGLCRCGCGCVRYVNWFCWENGGDLLLCGCVGCVVCDLKRLGGFSVWILFVDWTWLMLSRKDFGCAVVKCLLRPLVVVNWALHA